MYRVCLATTSAWCAGKSLCEGLRRSLPSTLQTLVVSADRQAGTTFVAILDDGGGGPGVGAGSPAAAPNPSVLASSAAADAAGAAGAAGAGADADAAVAASGENAAADTDHPGGKERRPASFGFGLHFEHGRRVVHVARLVLNRFPASSKGLFPSIVSRHVVSLDTKSGRRKIKSATNLNRPAALVYLSANVPILVLPTRVSSPPPAHAVLLNNKSQPR